MNAPRWGSLSTRSGRLPYPFMEAVSRSVFLLSESVRDPYHGSYLWTWPASIRPKVTSLGDTMKSPTASELLVALAGFLAGGLLTFLLTLWTNRTKDLCWE